MLRIVATSMLYCLYVLPSFVYIWNGYLLRFILGAEVCGGGGDIGGSICLVLAIMSASTEALLLFGGVLITIWYISEINRFRTIKGSS